MRHYGLVKIQLTSNCLCLWLILPLDSLVKLMRLLNAEDIVISWLNPCWSLILRLRLLSSHHWGIHLHFHWLFQGLVQYCLLFQGDSVHSLVSVKVRSVRHFQASYGKLVAIVWGLLHDIMRLFLTRYSDLWQVSLVDWDYRRLFIKLRNPDSVQRPLRFEQHAWLHVIETLLASDHWWLSLLCLWKCW